MTNRSYCHYPNFFLKITSRSVNKTCHRGGDSRWNRNLWDNRGLMCWKCVIYGALERVELNKDGCLSVTEWNVINSTCWVKGEKMESDSLTPAVSHWSAMAPSGFHSLNRKYTDITKGSWIWFLMQKSKKAGRREKQEGRENAIRWNIALFIGHRFLDYNPNKNSNKLIKWIRENATLHPLKMYIKT